MTKSTSIESFKEHFWRFIEDDELNVPEINDTILDDVLEKFFSITKYSDAYRYINNFVNEFIPYEYKAINWDLGRPEVESTPEYINWKRCLNVNSIVCDCVRYSHLCEVWVDIHGKSHTDEEAAEIAANKWVELLFNFHLQDNGALDEEHSFNASLLATYLGEKARKNITEETVERVRNLFKDFYLHYIGWQRDRNEKDIDWMMKNLPDPEGDYNWGYVGYPYCDYNANYPLYLILLNAGIEDRDIRGISPWKTGIDIRVIDNAVVYITYQNQEEL